MNWNKPDVLIHVAITSEEGKEKKNNNKKKDEFVAFVY
jgi:hypothetical protein